MPLRAASLAAVLLAACATAQPNRTLPDDAWCTDDSGGDRERVCEVRETVVSARRLDIDATPNGGIRVRTWDRPDVLVRARVAAGAATDAEAARLVEATRVRVAGGQIRSASPDARTGWVSVSYEIFAPRQTDLRLRTHNGGVEVDGVHGAVEARTVNGGVSLSDVTGEVVVRTTNGGVSVALDGDAWEGDGLDVETRNGGIALDLPRGYSARLDAETRMGHISTEGLRVPSADRAQGTGDHVEATLGRGGRALRLATANGSITVRQVR